jgi:hypothetical protein
MNTPARRALQRQVGAKVLLNPDTQKKCLRARMQNPTMKAGIEYHSAKIWRLRDSRGRVHEFRNLKHFVRENPDLFLPEDVQWTKHGRHQYCRALALNRLRPDNKWALAQWKGWTWYSTYERRFNDGHDLLDRVQPKDKNER